jgi:hypothetical protein
VAGSGPANDQYALIVGAMKSGTSALFDLLSQHPAVSPSRVKEPEFFSQHQGHGLPVPRYRDLWDFDPQQHRVALEASTGYAKYPQEQGVAQRIAAAGLVPRFLYVLRDPIARISSQVTYATWGRRGAVADFRDPQALAFSKYAEQLDQFTAVFPAERILLIDHRLLQQDPVATADRVFGFLELEPMAVAPPTAAKNAARPRSDWERRLMRHGGLARLATAAPPGLKDSLRRASSRGAAPAPVLSGETAAELRTALAPDMARLQEQWGFDVAQWGFGTARAAS